MSSITSDIFVTQEKFDEMMDSKELVKINEGKEELYLLRKINCVFSAETVAKNCTQGIILKFKGLE